MVMESRGFKVDIEKLKLLEREFNGILSRLRDNIYILTDSQFNINSPKQLGEILFVKMALKGGKRGRSGYSTNEKVLSSLIDEHRVIGEILEYRRVQKLLSGYINFPLIKGSGLQGRGIKVRGERTVIITNSIFLSKELGDTRLNQGVGPKQLPKRVPKNSYQGSYSAGNGFQKGWGVRERTGYRKTGGF